MSPDRFRQINALADAALTLTERRRAAFLDQACEGDEELRRQVENLVAAHETSGDFLAAPVLDLLAKDLASTGAPSSRQIGRYTVVSTLGAGGVGEVLLARDPQLVRDVALKLLSPQFADDPQQLQRFQQEARAASAFAHPNIVTIYEIGEAGGCTFIAQEFVPGPTLRQALASGPIELARVIDIGAQAASALAAAHAAGIVHRDIKPENVMVRRTGWSKSSILASRGLSAANPPALSSGLPRN